jgi:hypothetical protein
MEPRNEQTTGELEKQQIELNWVTKSFLPEGRIIFQKISY